MSQLRCHLLREDLTSLKEDLLPAYVKVTVDLCPCSVDFTEQYEIIFQIEFFASLVSNSLVECLPQKIRGLVYHIHH